MKQIFNLTFYRFQNDRAKKIISKSMSIITLLAFLHYIVGCGYYFKVREESDKISPDTQAQLDLKGKYVILHYSGLTKHFYNIEMKNDSIIGDLGLVAPHHSNHLIPKKKGGNRYKKSIEGEVVNEVHIYIENGFLPKSFENAAFPFTSIQKIYVYSKDGVATAAAWLLPPLLTIGIIIAIVAESSCPYIYTYDGETYQLAGEIYGGATYSALERPDYMPLPGFNSFDGVYQLKIANELKEIQYTNLSELLLIQHSSECDVLIDKRGNFQTFQSVQLPRNATSINGTDLTLAVREKDNSIFAFDDEGVKNSVNGLILTFRNNSHSKTGKLILRAKNSVWADYAFGNFTKLFGTYYENWDNEQKKLSGKKLRKNALDQDIPLSVYLETQKGWKFIDYFEVVGPLSFQDIVLPISLSKAESNTIKIKLETGFKFWELDYAAMDFSKNISVQSISLPLISALDENGKDVKSALIQDDDHYLIQPDIGNEVVLKFASPDESSLYNPLGRKSIFFHSKGYYERIRDYNNNPDWISLITHKHKHAFSKYSWNEYQKVKPKRELTAKQ